MRRCLAFCDDAVEPHAVVDRAERIVGAPDDLHRHSEPCAAGNFIKTRFCLRQARCELFGVRALRHCRHRRTMRRTLRGRDACVEQRCVDMVMRVGDALEGPLLRVAAPQGWWWMGEGEVFHTIAGWCGCHTGDHRDGGDQGAFCVGLALLIRAVCRSIASEV